MEYQALYRKYRPQLFAEVVGQDHVTTTIGREIAAGQVAHAYLFSGPRGTGKTTTARIFAKALNCPDRTPEGEPCDACDSCRAITTGTSFDVIEMDAASHNSVDDIRDLNLSVTTVASVGGGRRVFILDEAHMLSKSAANALLKTLEEPPSHVHFILATTEPYRLLDTIRSRTQRFDFHPVSLTSLVDHLERIAGLEEYHSGREGLVAIGRHAKGSVRDSLSLLEQVAALGNGTVDVAGVRGALGLADAEKFPRLARAIDAADAGAALALVQELDDEGVDLRRFFAEAIAFFRGVFLTSYAPDVTVLVDEPAEIIEDWKTLASVVPTGTVLRAIDELGEGLIRIREGREERLMVELTLLKLVRPELSDDVASLRQRLDALERMVRTQGASAVPPPARPPSSKPDAAPKSPAKEPVEAPPAPAPEPKKSPPAEADEPNAVPEAPFATEPEGPVTSDQPARQVSLADVEQVWPQAIGVLREKIGSRRFGLLREASPGSVTDDRFDLWLPTHMGFHLDRLSADRSVAAAIAEELQRLLGASLQVGFAPRPGGDAVLTAPVDARDDTAALPDKATMDEAPDDVLDPSKLLADALGAEVIEEVEYE